MSGVLLSPDNLSHEIRLVGEQPEHACYEEQTVTTYAMGKGGAGVWKVGLTSMGLSPLDKFTLLDIIRGIQLAGVMLSADRSESC